MIVPVPVPVVTYRSYNDGEDDGHGTGIPEWMTTGLAPHWRRTWEGWDWYEDNQRSRG